jgi:hypothetical protein
MSAGRRGSLVPGLVMAGLALLVVLVGVPLANSSLLARVTNSTDTSATAGYFTCTSAATGTTGTTAYVAYPFKETTGLLGAADVSGNNRTGTYSALGITYGASGPCPRDGAQAVTLNGSSGYIVGPATPTNPQTFRLEIWFKTTVGGGKLIGLGTASSGASGQYDRHIWLSNTGLLNFGIYSGGIHTVASTATYLDGNWHDVVATMGQPSDANPGIRLYVDGNLLAADASSTTAESDSGYWRIGYDNLSGWGTNQPTNFFFTGSLAFASTYTYAMTPAQIAAHYRAGI